MNKKLLAFGIPILAIALVAATGFVVHSFVIQTDVYEAFSVQYSIIGDAGNWNGEDKCVDLPEVAWITLGDGVVEDVGGLYPGEGRKVCVKITNAGEAPLTYTVTSTVINGDATKKAKCEAAFGATHTLTGTAVGSDTAGNYGGQLGITVDGKGIVVAENAEPVNDCKIKIELARG